jgi:hypothetical protein
MKLKNNSIVQYKTPISALYGILRRVGCDTDTTVSGEISASIFSVLRENFPQNICTFTPFSLKCHEDGSSTFLRKVGTHIPAYMT